MPTPRLPVLPRLGFALLSLLLACALVAFVVLFLVVPDERWSFLLPMAVMLAGLVWVRGARRAWTDRRRAAPAPPTPAEGQA